MWRRAIFLVASTMNSAAAAADYDAESVFRGRRIAEVNCAVCHAIAQYDESEMRDAPPLREISDRMSPDMLRKMLQGPVFKKHAIMPDFEPDPMQASDLANYMLDIASPD
jgi:cytochrome c